MSDIEAYAAGLLDGEGTVTIREERRPVGVGAESAWGEGSVTTTTRATIALRVRRGA